MKSGLPRTDAAFVNWKFAYPKAASASTIPPRRWAKPSSGLAGSYSPMHMSPGHQSAHGSFCSRPIAPRTVGRARRGLNTVFRACHTGFDLRLAGAVGLSTQVNFGAIKNQFASGIAYAACPGSSGELSRGFDKMTSDSRRQAVGVD